MTEGLPIREQFTGQPSETEAGVPNLEQRVSAGTTLQDLARDHVLLHHGALFIWGRMELDPLQEIVNRSRAELQFAFLDLPLPIFPTLRAPWHSRLILIPRPHAEPVIRWLGAVSGVDRNRKTFFRTRVADVQVFDALAIDRMAVIPDHVPTVPVTMFLVDSMGFRLEAHSASSSIGEGARIEMLRPDPETIRMGRAILGEREDVLT